jgi:hypothetical protein
MLSHGMLTLFGHLIAQLWTTYVHLVGEAELPDSSPSGFYSTTLSNLEQGQLIQCTAHIVQQANRLHGKVQGFLFLLAAWCETLDLLPTALSILLDNCPAHR